MRNHTSSCTRHRLPNNRHLPAHWLTPLSIQITLTSQRLPSTWLVCFPGASPRSLAHSAVNPNHSPHHTAYLASDWPASPAHLPAHWLTPPSPVERKGTKSTPIFSAERLTGGGVARHWPVLAGVFLFGLPRAAAGAHGYFQLEEETVSQYL